MKSGIVYLACPYTHDDPAVRRARFEAVNRLAARLIAAGVVVYSPISFSHPICETGVDVAWEFWAEHDLAFLAVCDSMLVYCLDGWDRSVGIRAEIEACARMGKPVKYHLPEMEEIELTEELQRTLGVKTCPAT